MEESKGNDEALVENVSGCTVAGSAERTLGQAQGSFGEGFEGGSCNGDELMVEVLGSEVYVDGVCTSGTGENLDEAGPGEGRDSDAAPERPADKDESVGGDGGGNGDSGSGEAGVSGSDDVSHGGGAEIEGSLVVSESVEDKDQVSVTVVTREVAVEVVVVEEDTVRESEMGGGGGDDEDQSSEGCVVAAGFSSVDMEIDKAMNVEMVAGEIVVDKEAISGGSDADSVEDKQEIEIQEEAVRDPGVENVDGAGGPAPGPLVVESPLADEDTEMGSVELGGGLAGESGEQDGRVAGDSVDASKDSTTEVVGASEEALDSRTGTLVATAAAVEDSGVGKFCEEKSAVLNHEVDLNPRDEQGQVVVGGEVGNFDKGVVSDMETNVGESLSVLEEKEEVKSEISGGSTEKPNTESLSSHAPAQVIVESEVTVTEVVSVSEQDEAGDVPLVESHKGQELEPYDVQVTCAEQVDVGGKEMAVLSDAEVPGTAECLKSEDHLDEGVTGEVSPVSVDTTQEVGVKEETPDLRQVGSHGEQQVELENQQEPLVKMDEVTDKGEPVDEDTTSLVQPTEVVGAGVTQSDDMFPDSVDESAIPLPSGDGEDLQDETALRSTGTDNQVGDYVDISPMDTDEVMISEMEVLEHPTDDQQLNTDECLDKDVTADSDVARENIAEEVVVTASDGFGLHGEQDSIAVEEVPDGDQPPSTSEEMIANSESLEPGSSLSVQEPSYELLPENEGVLSVADLVWGKVKSHPWWPGQIFDFTDASEKAMKHHKKDCLLVAYFGDRTFSWNEESTLKSFRTHFSQMVAQTNGETFQKAVNCALEEVSRRVELGLACSCVPNDFYDNISVQVVENAGIRSQSSRREGLDESIDVSFFQADKLVEYIRALAQCPLGGSDALGLTIAKAQLLGFGRFRGFCSLPEFQFCGELVENDTSGPRFEDIHPGDVFEPPLSKDDEQASSSREVVKVYRSSHKRKHDLRDGAYPKIKEKSLSELMGDTMDYPDEDYVSGKRRKNADSHPDDLTAQEGRKTISLAKVSTPPKQSFKIGECIRRVASQMTGSPSIKGCTERVQKLDGSSDRPGDGNDVSLQNSEGRAVDPTEYSSLDELLLQLHVIAQEPRKEYNFSKVIVNFFSDFRNSVIGGRHSSGADLMTADKVGGKRKKGSPETFEFDDMNDTYWTDRVIQNGVEEQPQPQPQPAQPPPRKSRKKDNQLGLSQPEKTPQTRRPYNRKRLSNGNHSATPEKPPSSISEKPPGYISENAPTELIMNFSEVKTVPSESNLNKMFRRFGPLKETETEVDRESSRARVVFKKCSDAEVAFNSAGKFKIFGPTLVNYQLNYNPVVQYKPSPLVVTLDHEMQLDLSAHDHELQLDLCTHEHEMHLDLSAHDHEMQLDLSNLSPFEVNLV